MARTDKAGYYHGCLMGNHDYGHLQPVPDYLNDLNAMHEAEKVLKDDELQEYLTTLYNSDANNPMLATAAQRAEAFLRTLGKWIE